MQRFALGWTLTKSLLDWPTFTNANGLAQKRAANTTLAPREQRRRLRHVMERHVSMTHRQLGTTAHKWQREPWPHGVAGETSAQTWPVTAATRARQLLCNRQHRVGHHTLSALRQSSLETDSVKQPLAALLPHESTCTAVLCAPKL